MMEEGERQGAIIIRRMLDADVASAARIDRLSFSLPWSEHSFKHEVTDNPDARAWVAEKMNEQNQMEIIGVAVLWLVLDEAHVGTLAVHPDHRQKGIGKSLMMTALREAAGENASLVYLEVRESNQPAIQLYLELGFQTVGERKKYYQDNGEDALLMTLPDLQTAVQKWDDLQK